MGHNSSKKHDRELFTEYEYTRLSQTFHINRSDLSSVNGDTFRVSFILFFVIIVLYSVGKELILFFLIIDYLQQINELVSY